jgi:hypothetical protein
MLASELNLNYISHTDKVHQPQIKSNVRITVPLEKLPYWTNSTTLYYICILACVGYAQAQRWELPPPVRAASYWRQPAGSRDAAGAK